LLLFFKPTHAWTGLRSVRVGGPVVAAETVPVDTGPRSASAIDATARMRGMAFLPNDHGVVIGPGTVVRMVYTSKKSDTRTLENGA
jgi:hypothetical protein